MASKHCFITRLVISVGVFKPQSYCACFITIQRISFSSIKFRFKYKMRQIPRYYIWRLFNYDQLSCTRLTKSKLLPIMSQLQSQREMYFLQGIANPQLGCTHGTQTPGTSRIPPFHLLFTSCRGSLLPLGCIVTLPL